MFKFTEFLSVAPEFLCVNTDRHADRLELIYIPPRERGNYRGVTKIIFPRATIWTAYNTTHRSLAFF
jgi:hypothetical protein